MKNDGIEAYILTGGLVQRIEPDRGHRACELVRARRRHSLPREDLRETITHRRTVYRRERGNRRTRGARRRRGIVRRRRGTDRLVDRVDG
jgi:hypothetical protein